MPIRTFRAPRNECNTLLWFTKRLRYNLRALASPRKTAITAMARKLSAFEVIRYFSGEECTEVLFEGSDDDLGMSDEEPFDNEPAFEPFEIEGI